jgi:hypothetical protein
MNYLTGIETQANIAVLWVVSRWLNRVGTASSPELAATLRPGAVVTGAENALQATLSVGRHVGVLQFQEDPGRWCLGARVSPACVLDHHVFRAAVREALLAQAVDDAIAGRQPSDVALGLTWLCSLDPAIPVPWGWNEGTEQAVREAGLRTVISNNTQWRQFRRWAVSLGLAISNAPRRGVQVLIPDPTTAVADTLPSLPHRSTAPVFIEKLAQRIPAIDHGVLERAVAELGVTYTARGDATVGPALAHALRRLEKRGAIHLRKADDASHRVSYRTRAGTGSFDDVEIAVEANE